ncbi:MAG: hypothetical protein WBN51_11505 [Gammaproteobacteria bacterium]
MNKIVAILFAISCFATSAVSGSILGVGMWFWIIIAAGVFVADSQFAPMFRELGSVAALLLGVISVFAVVLTLLAGTIGGSLKLDNREALLVFTFSMIAVSGLSLVSINKKLK